MLRFALAFSLLVGCTASETASPTETASDRALVVRVVGPLPGDPSQLAFAVRWVAGDGTEALPADLDDDDGVVALDGDRRLDDNAVYFDPDVGELLIDLDALGPGERVLRVTATDGAVTSPTLDVAVSNRRTQ